jgi:hypothetical protein
VRVLITNSSLSTRTGTETYVRDLALGLLGKGHSPVIYSPQLGSLANELRALTIPVVDDLASISGGVDIIHGQHRHETMTALLHFPDVPAVFFVHDWHAWQDLPLSFPRILRYVAVDNTRRDRLVLENGIADAMVTVLPNGVDTQRFRPRTSLPEQPQRALVFSNYVTHETQVSDLRRACTMTGMSLDVAGAGMRRITSEPERTLSEYELVFAMGRSALEAMAVGSGVVIWGLEGLAGFVHTGNFARLQESNFGRRALRPATVVELEREIRRFDPKEVRAIQQHVRAELNQSHLIDQHLALYRDVIDEASSHDWTPVAELRTAAEYLKTCLPRAQIEARRMEERQRRQRQRNRLLDMVWITLTLVVFSFGVRVELMALANQAFGLVIGTVPICMLLCFGLYLLRRELRGEIIV